MERRARRFGGCRLENLRLLCPNCHGQTENFAGRNVTRNGSGANAAA
jgi:hypothetical protein